MPAVTLNDNFLRTGLVCPEGKHRIEYTDAARTGLYLLVRATSPGQGTYYLRTKIDGKTVHSKLGRTTDISLKDARAKARKLKAEIELGADPRAEKARKRETLDWDTFFTTHYYPHAVLHKRSHRNDRDLHNRWISPALGKQRLDRITRLQIEQVHQAMFDQGLAASSCNGMIRVVRRAFNLAIEWGLVDKNPAAKIKLFHEDNKRQRILTQEELQRLTTILKSDKNQMVANVVLFLLSTGARVSEALGADWSDIDRPGRSWTIPIRNSKSKRIRRVPLSDAALHVLDNVGTEGKSSHLFINTRTGKRLTTIAKVWCRIREEAGMPDLRLHDLRHSFASMLVNAGVSIYEVKEILGHSDIKITERYSHLAPETQQKAASAASDQIIAALDSAA
jgi:integrase